MHAIIHNTVSAKFVFNTDLDALDNPTEESERFIQAVSLFFDCFSKLTMEPPLYKLYPNKIYRDFSESMKVYIWGGGGGRVWMVVILPQ